MRMAIAAGGVVILTAVSACTHTESSMQAGTHNMPGPPKTGAMSNQVMPERNPNCSPEALATMPPEHRQACVTR
jgi:hypothetical protein